MGITAASQGHVLWLRSGTAGKQVVSPARGCTEALYDAARHGQHLGAALAVLLPLGCVIDSRDTCSAQLQDTLVRAENGAERIQQHGRESTMLKSVGQRCALLGLKDEDGNCVSSPQPLHGEFESLCTVMQ